MGAIGDNLFRNNVYVVWLMSMALGMLALLDAFNWYVVPLLSWEVVVAVGACLCALPLLVAWPMFLWQHHEALAHYDRFRVATQPPDKYVAPSSKETGYGSTPSEQQWRRTRTLALIGFVSSATMTAVYSILLAQIAFLYHDTTNQDGAQEALNHNFEPASGVSFASLFKREFIANIYVAWILASLFSASRFLACRVLQHTPKDDATTAESHPLLF